MTLYALVRSSHSLGCEMLTRLSQMWHDESVKNLAGDLEVKAGVERLNSTIAVAKVKEAAANVLALLR